MNCLLIVGYIREAVYPDWVSNVVLVKKVKWKITHVCGLYGFEQVLS